MQNSSPHALLKPDEASKLWLYCEGVWTSTYHYYKPINRVIPHTINVLKDKSSNLKILSLLYCYNQLALEPSVGSDLAKELDLSTLVESELRLERLEVTLYTNLPGHV